MEEFRRRKNLKRYYELMKEKTIKDRKDGAKKTNFYDMDSNTVELNS